MSEYIMNRDLLKRHCESMCHKFKDIPTSGTYGEHRLVLELLEQTEWIPVSERLPEERNTYEVTLQGIGELEEEIDNEVAYATWLGDGDNWIYHNVDNWKDKKVIAWMPLPKPYEPHEISDRNLKMWEDIYAEEKRRKGSDKE